MVFGLGLVAIGWAAAEGSTASSSVASDVYVDAVELVRRIYLEPRDLDPHAMLAAAALQLADDLHWLQVRVDDDMVVLSHGSGTPIGMVGAESLDALPGALSQLERLVSGSAYPSGEVDVRLSVLTGAVEALDRHSRVLTDERLERFESRLSGTQVGIGAFFERSGEHVVVSGLSDGGPAALSGLLVGDHLLQIDGRSTVGMTPADVASRIRGEAGTAVAIVVSRNGQVKPHTLIRAEVVIPNVSWHVLAGQVGYVYIDHISQRTVANLRTALDGLAEVGALDHGLVLDLRGNTGGSMKESAHLADLFVRDGLLLRTVGKDGGPVPNLQGEMYARNDGTEPDVPLVLVVDERTASGSEILAGALVELGRAAVIGTRTYGKGTVQKVYPLAEGVRLKLTVARYLLANERSIDQNGIVPDVRMGKVVIDGAGVRFEGWRDATSRVDWESRVPHVVAGDVEEDLAVDIARRAVLSVTGSDRRLLVEALVAEGDRVRREQTARLASILAPSVDWGAEPRPGGSVEADVVLRAEPMGGSQWALTASVTNHSAVPLHRALVQLSCPTVPYWDGVVVPIGLLPAHAQAVRSVAVDVPAGVVPRLDSVDVKVVADGRDVRQVGEVVLPSGSEPLPAFEVVARLTGHGEARHAELTVHNRSAIPVDGLELHVGVPDDGRVSLQKGSMRLARLPPSQSETVLFDVDVTLDVDAVGLFLGMESHKYGALAQWPIILPVDGTAVGLRAPRIEAHPAVRASPLGRFVLPVVVLDDRQIHHVVVFANGQKVAWSGPSSGGRIELAARFPLVAGNNEIVIRARDDQGLVSEQRLGIRGVVAPDVVDAGL